MEKLTQEELSSSRQLIALGLHQNIITEEQAAKLITLIDRETSDHLATAENRETVYPTIMTKLLWEEEAKMGRVLAAEASCESESTF